MKPNYVAALLAAGVIPGGIAAEGPKRVAMREVVTHDDIVETARQARENKPAPVFTPAQGEDPSVKNRPSGILSRSDILCYSGKAALVPKRAILHVPKNYSDRIGFKEGSALGGWSDFFASNRAWIRTVAVTRAQAEGREKLDEATLKSFEKETRVVVATYQDGPISVTPLRIPEEPAAPAAGVASAQTPAPVAQP